MAPLRATAQAAAALAVLLGAVGVFAGMDCKKEASHSYPASQVGYANEEQKYYLCGSLESSCLHPDPSYWAKNGKGTPYNQVCLGPNEEGGQDVSRATENGVACTFTKYDPAEPEGCDPSWVVMGDLGVYFYYTPCTNYTGNVTVNCKTYRQGDDWMDGNPATATRYITGGEFTFTLDIQEKPCNATLCTGTGSCQPPNGCVCKPGYFGQNCQNSPASSAVVSAALVVVLALAALFVNL